MSYLMIDYDKALAQILSEGVWHSNKRTGVRTKSIFGMELRFPLDRVPKLSHESEKMILEFPILTRRKVWPKAVFAELCWFLSGSTNNETLKAYGCEYWTPWTDEKWAKAKNFNKNCFGPTYGFQLRHFNGEYGNGIGGYNWDNGCEGYYAGVNYGSVYGAGGVDQIQYMLDRIKSDPSDRRIMFSLWNPQQLADMKLPPCAYAFQLLIDDDGYMSGVLTQRSADIPVGVPANIQFYSALLCMFAQQTGYKPKELIHHIADAHIYENQFHGVEVYLGRDIKESPILVLEKASSLFNYVPNSFALTGYNSFGKIDFPVAV